VDRQDARRAGDANLVSYLRHLARCAPRGSVREAPGYLCFAGGHDYPGTYTNGVIRRGRGSPPAELLAAADDFFSPMRRGYMVWVRGDADSDLEEELRRRSWWLRPPETGNPGIASDHPIADMEAPEGTQLVRVSSQAGRRDYLRVTGAAYGLEGAPDDLLERVLFSMSSLEGDETTAFVAYRGARPVSCCLAYIDDDVAGLQWASTLPEARGTGLGTAVFTAACNAAFAAGTRLAVAQTSAIGTPIWVRLGFEVVTYYRRYLAPVAGGALQTRHQPGPPAST